MFGLCSLAQSQQSAERSAIPIILSWCSYSKICALENLYTPKLNLCAVYTIRTTDLRFRW